MTAQRAPRPSPSLDAAAVPVPSIPWRERPVLNLPTAAELLGCSVSQLYALRNDGRLDFVKVAGRVCVRTAGITALVDEAEPWMPTPTANTKAAQAERKRLAAARLAS